MDKRPRADDDGSKWHLDKRVPITIIAALLGQMGITLWQGGAFSQRVTNLEMFMQAAGPKLEAVIELKTKMDMLQSSMTEIKSALTAIAATQKEPSRR